MVNIAIVEDEQAAAQNLSCILTAFAQENNVVFNIKSYQSAEDFLSEYVKGLYQVVFFDVELPGLNGMDAAGELRKTDTDVVIIFVTNSAQYAVSGYEVSALYYILKPAVYQNVAYKLHRALSIISSKNDIAITIQQAGGVTSIASSTLMYVEVADHKLSYHTTDAVYTTYGALDKVESQLRPYHFYRCNNCYLVNARYIASVAGYTVTLANKEQLTISHPKKKQFMLDLTSWLGGGNR